MISMAKMVSKATCRHQMAVALVVQPTSKPEMDRTCSDSILETPTTYLQNSLAFQAHSVAAVAEQGVVPDSPADPCSETISSARSEKEER